MIHHPPRAAVPPLLSRMLTCNEVAEQLQLSQRHVRRLIATRVLPVHRLGAAVRISHDDLARYIAGTRHSGPRLT
jgi:excisionase family DNA binding protein